ncbi:MAG: energy transducer TonB [Terracidiphilus sp.]|jgi:TonB family protein
MDKNCFKSPPKELRHLGVRLTRAAALALMLALVMPARAADERAVRSRVPPVYPEIAKRMKITGAVHVSVTIDAEGKVTDAKTISGNRMLGAAAEDAVRRWRFESGTGTTTMEIELTFVLAQ